VTGLREIAGRYDSLICDVWGVIHNGVHVYDGAVDALRRFRSAHGPVVLLSNAPRPAAAIEAQFARLGVPTDCYDAIQTSGAATRDDLALRADSGRLALFHLGPERDRGLFEGLPVQLVDEVDAELVVCTGPFNDETETPDDYAAMLARMKERDLTMLCANPDIVVQRGSDLVYCAGALAHAYERDGGTVAYYGKPHPPIYRSVLAGIARIAGRPAGAPLAIGDGPETDIRGANGAGIDALFIADGVHGADFPQLEPDALEAFFAARGLVARAAIHRLVW
jgi:HAD superfamily hydrolase (TIGR01459 family)